MRIFSFKSILTLAFFGLSLFGYSKQTFAESVSKKVSNEIDCNYYDDYSLNNFFIRQAELQKHTGFFNKNWFESADFSRFNVYGLNDDSNLEADARLMFEKVSKFLEEAASVDVKDFEDYCVNYLIQNSDSGGVFNTKNSDEIDELVKDGDAIVCYRGTRNKNFAEEMRRGKLYVGGRVSRCSNSRQEGTGIYATSNQCHAAFYGCMPMLEAGKKEGKGEVVKLALASDAKLVSVDYLGKVFKKMVENNKEYFKEYLDLKNSYEYFDQLYLSSWQFNFKFAKEVMGFDFDAESATKSLNQRMEEYESKLNNFFSGGKDIKNMSDEEINEVKNKIISERDNFLKKHPELEHTISKPFYVNKVVYLERDPGLLARLMGFDVLYEKGFNLRELTHDSDLIGFINSSDDFKDAKLFFDTWNVVNWGKLFVCSDLFKEFNLANSKSTII